MITLRRSNKALLKEQESYWEKNGRISVIFSEGNVRFISSLLREDDKNECTSEWRENMKKDVRFLLHLNKGIKIMLNKGRDKRKINQCH